MQTPCSTTILLVTSQYCAQIFQLNIVKNRSQVRLLTIDKHTRTELGNLSIDLRGKAFRLSTSPAVQLLHKSFPPMHWKHRCRYDGFLHHHFDPHSIQSLCTQSMPYHLNCRIAAHYLVHSSSCLHEQDS
jgi:hypothetical protein